jgi:hypothetical protein
MKNYDGMISAGELVIRSPELCGSPTNSHLGAKEEGRSEVNDDFGLPKYLFSYFEGNFNIP